MSEVVVYGVPGSPFMRSVLVALEEKRAPYRIEPLAPGALKSEEYRRLHPFGRVPAIRRGEGELDRLLGRSEHLAGAEFSLADVQLAPQIEYLAATPEGASMLAGTALRAWLDRVGERASMRATLPPEALRRAA
jgi:glutathione S-transferase